MAVETSLSSEIYLARTEILNKIIEFKKKELNFNLKNNVLTIYSSDNKLFEKVNMLGDVRVGIKENFFYKGVLRIKLEPKT